MNNYLSRINLKYLQAFVLTAEKGSFSSAARTMGKAQSVVSSAIANFEIDLDVELFSRHSRYPELTEAGKMLLPEAQAILKRCNYFEKTATSLEAAVESEITIAIDEHLTVASFAVLLKKFSAQYPLVQLNLTQPVREVVAEAVLSGEAQLGILKRDTGIYENLISMTHTTEPLDILVHKDHPLANEKNIDIEKLAMYRQVALNRKHGQKNDSQIISSQVWFAESIFTAVNMIYSGSCWGILPRFILEHWPKKHDFVRIELEISNLESEFTSDVVWHRSKKLGPAAKWWCDNLAKDC